MKIGLGPNGGKWLFSIVLGRAINEGLQGMGQNPEIGMVNFIRAILSSPLDILCICGIALFLGVRDTTDSGDKNPRQ